MNVQTSASAAKKIVFSVRIKEKVQAVLIALLACSYVLLQVFYHHWLETWVNILLIGIIVFVLPTMRGAFLIISTVLLSIGIFLLAMQNANLQQWLDGLSINLSLIAVLIFSPLLGIPVKTGGYVNMLQIVFERKMNEPYFLFLGSKILTHVLGIVLNIGSVTIVYQLSLASKIRSVRLLADGISRGYGSVTFWSPYFGTMALILSHLPVSWSSIGGYLLGLACISFIVSLVVDWPMLKQVHQECKQQGQSANGRPLEKSQLHEAAKKVVELFILLILMVVIVMIVVMLTGLSMVLCICLFSMVFPFVWCVCSGKGKEFSHAVRDHLLVNLPNMKKEIVLFILAGFVSGAVVHTNASHILVEQIAQIGSFKMGISFGLSLLVVISAIIGLHPIIVVTLLVTSIEPGLIGISPEYFAVLLLASVGIANMISPASAINNVLAYLLKTNVTDISIKWNFKYVLMMIIILPIYISLTRL